MEGSGCLFQLDEDDVFSSDSFLEELDQVEKVHRVSSNSAQAPSGHGHKQKSFTGNTHVTHAPSSMPPQAAVSDVSHTKTPNGRDGKRFSFKSKTSPEIPLPSNIGSNKQRDSPINFEGEIKADNGMVQSKTFIVQRDNASRTNLAPAPNLKTNGPTQSVPKVYYTIPVGDSNFHGRQSGSNVQPMNPVAAPVPKAGSGSSFSPGPNQIGGTTSIHMPQPKLDMSSNFQTPPPRSHDPWFGTPMGNRNTTPGNSVRTSGNSSHTPGNSFRSQGNSVRTPEQSGNRYPRQQYTPLTGNGQQRSSTAMGQNPRHRTPIAGHAQRQHTPMNRHLPNQRQSTPGQPSRPVLTPRVAQLCKGSGPSPGPGAVHGGTRKFPGPAGLLPKLSPGQKMKDAAAALQKKAEEEKSSQEAEELSEEIGEVGDFEGGPWFRMKTDLGIKDRDPNSILQQNNIALVIRKASLKQLTKNKVSHLCVMIKTISLNSTDASVSLCDPSGEMQGTIHRRLIEEYQGDLRPGSVLVLRQVGVLSPSQRNHYLNITPSNLIQVFASESNSRPGSQRTPKRARKRSGKTPLRKESTQKASSGHKRASPSMDDNCITVERHDANEKQQQQSDASDAVTMVTEHYIEDDDVGIWEEMLDDENEDDILMDDSLIVENHSRSKSDWNKQEQTVNTRQIDSRLDDEICQTKSSVSSVTAISPSSSLSAQGTTHMSSNRTTSPPSYLNINTTPRSSLSAATSASSSSSSFKMLPRTNKQCQLGSSKPTPSTSSNFEEMKRPCLRDISAGIGSNADRGHHVAEPNKGQKLAINTCREEIIGDLLVGLEDELFDDF